MEGNQRESTKIPLVIPIHHATAKISKIVHSNARFLSADPDIGNLFQDNIITAYRNCQNLRQCLVRSKLPADDDEIPGTFSCGRNRCKTCPHVCQTDTLNGPDGSISIRNTFSCTSKNVVYAIQCIECSAIYVGETGRCLAGRFREHLRHPRR